MSALPNAVGPTTRTNEVARKEKVVLVEGQSQETTPEPSPRYAEVCSTMVSHLALGSKRAVETWGQVQVAQLAAQRDSAQQQAANADAAHKRQSEVAVAFLTRLATLGVVGMACLGFFAHAKILDGQAFGILASTFFTVLFGSGLYGTSLRGKDSEK